MQYDSLIAHVGVRRQSAVARTACLAVYGLLAGCVTPPTESSHSRQLTAESVGLGAAAVEPAADGWWNGFQDPQLDRLIHRGLEQSPTLAQAQDRIAQALALARSAQAGLAPHANLDGSAMYQRAPQKYLIPPPLAGHTFSEGQAGASLSWDLDFWGRQAEALRRARKLTDSARMDVENARLMLAGSITRAYVELYREYALADIALRSEAQRQNIVDITRRRVSAGLDTQLELREAEGQLPQARVARTQARAAADLAVHQLAALTGLGAGVYAEIARPTLEVRAALPVPATLPINLLARRPDVISARLGVEAADAGRLAAKAAFYPDVSLRALAGIGAFGLGNLLHASALGASAGPLISLPLFDGGRLRAQYQGAQAELDSAVDGYNATVLHAVEETADEITRLESLAAERIDQQTTLDASEAAYKLAEERYRAGLASYLSVLNAETQVLAARQAMVDIDTAQAMARVSLLLALGGSFDPRSTPPAAAPPAPAPAAARTTSTDFISSPRVTP